MRTIIVKRSPELVPEIIQRLKNGEVIILPTDTSYALVGNAYDPQSLEKIAQLKQWKKPQPMAIFTTKKRADEVAFITPECMRLIEHFPYPVMTIVRKKNTVSEVVTGGYPNLLLACPDQFIYDLVEAVPFPMACTSASLSMELKAIDLETALRFFEGKIPLIVDGGRSKYGSRSTLVDFTVEVPTILNYGAVSVDDLRPILPEIVLPSHLMK